MITGNTKLHLNCTQYYDEEGDHCDSLEEARDRSVDKTAVITIRKQYCYLKEFSELTGLEKEMAEMATEHLFPDCTPEQIMYLIGANNGRILEFGYWDSFQWDLDHGILSVAK